MKIAIAGTGYVGLSNAILLAQHNQVIALDILQEKVDMINNKISPIVDKEIEEYLATKDLNLVATTDAFKAYKDAEYVVIATPTNYDPNKNYFNTRSVEEVIANVLAINPEATIVIKSTVPVGYTERVRKIFDTENIIFSPEFLREGKALYDNLYPSRIIVGEQSERAERFANLLKEGAIKEDIQVLFTNSTEAEAVKLFSNTYLALRVAYFNELDTYAEIRGLDTKQIIEGVGLDPRIGTHYNNPSFGYGGYCLPKDTKQLAEIYKDNTISGSLIESIPVSNELRMDYIAAQIAGKLMQDMTSLTPVVGIYRLNAKKEGDNFRESAMLGVLNRVQRMNITTIAYEPLLPDGTEYFGCRIVNSLELFKIRSQIILANRKSSDLEDVMEKVYSRDIYMRD